MYNLVSAISTITASVELLITQFADQVSTRFISQLISSISRVLRKLLKYFKGTAISTYLTLPSGDVLPVIPALNLNDSESFMLSFRTSLLTAIDFLMFLNSYHFILLDYTLTPQHLDLLHYLFMYYMFQLCSQ